MKDLTRTDWKVWSEGHRRSVDSDSENVIVVGNQSETSLLDREILARQDHFENAR